MRDFVVCSEPGDLLVLKVLAGSEELRPGLLGVQHLVSSGVSKVIVVWATLCVAGIGGYLESAQGLRVAGALSKGCWLKLYAYSVDIVVGVVPHHGLELRVVDTR